jgi:hypothetical protein
MFCRPLRGLQLENKRTGLMKSEAPQTSGVLGECVHSHESNDRAYRTAPGAFVKPKRTGTLKQT